MAIVKILEGTGMYQAMLSILGKLLVVSFYPFLCSQISFLEQSLQELFFYLDYLGAVSKQPSTKSEQTGDRKQEGGKTPSADSFVRLKGKISAV